MTFKLPLLFSLNIQLCSAGKYYAAEPMSDEGRKDFTNTNNKNTNPTGGECSDAAVTSHQSQRTNNLIKHEKIQK